MTSNRQHKGPAWGRKKIPRHSLRMLFATLENTYVTRYMAERYLPADSIAYGAAAWKIADTQLYAERDDVEEVCL